MNTIVKPNFLIPGDTIGIIAPARKVMEEELRAFTIAMNNAGYNIAFSENLFGSNNQFSGTDRERANDLLKMFEAPDVKAVFSARGGYGSARLFKYIDWNIIRDNPKWFAGFSDATALHSAFGKFMESLHCIMPISLHMDEPQDGESLDYLIKALRGDDIDYSISFEEYNYPGEIEAPIVGGNLSVLYSLSGSIYEPDYEGKILVLEDLDEYLYHVDRMVLNFELRDIFKKISGMVIGGFSDMHDNQVPFGQKAYEILAEKVHKYRIPALFNFPVGHKKNNFPLIFGRLSTLRSGREMNSLSMY